MLHIIYPIYMPLLLTVSLAKRHFCMYSKQCIRSAKKQALSPKQSKQKAKVFKVSYDKARKIARSAYLTARLTVLPCVAHSAQHTRVAPHMNILHNSYYARTLRTKEYMHRQRARSYFLYSYVTSV